MGAIDQVRAAFRRAELRARERVGVACSGGRDSTLLLALAAEEIPARSLRVIHVNHRLRGAASDADARCVRAFGRRLGIGVSILTAPIEEGPGLEARARDARYDAFRRAARRHDLRTLLLAHHWDDQVETVVMRLDRGAGPRGLAGIPARRSLTTRCRLLRPLLNVDGATIEAAARDLGLRWREDESNDDRRHTRNRIRQDVLPHLDRELVRRVTSAAAAAHRSAQLAADQYSAELITFRSPVVGGFRLDGLRAVPEALAFAVIERAAPGPLNRDTWRSLERILEGETGRVTLPCGRDARVHDGTLWISADRAMVETMLGPRTISTRSIGVTWAATGHHLTGSVAPSPDSALADARRDPLSACLARARLVGRLSLRPPHSRDLMVPIGGSGRRSTRAILSSMGVAHPLRTIWPIVHDQRGPVWVPGGPTAARVAWDRGPAITVQCEGPAPHP